MTNQPNPIDQMKEWARTAPAKDGTRPTHQILSDISESRVVAILLTDKGQVYHISDIDLNGATLSRLEQPRTALNELMESYGIKDGPEWSKAGD